MKILTVKQIKLLKPESLEAMRKEGLTCFQIAKKCGVSAPTICQRCRDYKIKSRQSK